MKIRVTNIPIRIEGKRYYPGSELEVSDEIYKTIKGNCIIVDEEVPTGNEENKGEEVEVEVEDENIKDEDLTEDQKIMNTSQYKNISKDDIMLKLAEEGVEFDPNLSKVELYKMLGSD